MPLQTTGGRYGRRGIYQYQMKDLALHILDIAQNAITAGASTVFIGVEEDSVQNTYRIRIRDNGRGMSKEVLERVTDPYYTSRTTRKVGLGIPLLKQNAEQAGGHVLIRSEPGKGTTIEAMFVHDHIDRPASGDIAGVLVLLIGANPELRFCYTHHVDGKRYVADTREIENELEGTPLADPKILRMVREMIDENLREIGAS